MTQSMTPHSSPSEAAHLAPSPTSAVWNAGSETLGYMRRNPSLVVGLGLIVGLLLFSGIGNLLVDTDGSRPLSAPPVEPPSAEYPLGTDRVGRDLLATMIAGTPLTLRIGFLAGLLGVGLATLLAFVAAFYGGLIDTVIQTVVDIGLTIPSLLILIIIAVSIQGPISVNQMALVVASTAWLWPTRVIRSEVLSLKQRAYVELARVSGMSGLEIIVKELIPNLLPYIMASLVGSVSSAILASVGLEALGLGPIDSPTLGMTIYWVILYAAVIQGWWWWWIPPIVILLLVFVGLFLISIGMDELANPRLRTSA